MKRQTRILSVGTHDSLLETLRSRLTAAGEQCTISTRETIRSALDVIETADCVVTVQQLPDGTGLSLLEQVRERRSELPVVLIAENGSERLARDATRADVTAYVSRTAGEDIDLESELADAVVHALDESRQSEVQKRELERFRLAVEQAGHSIYMTDAKGVIQYVNPEFEELTGYSAEEAIGKTPALFHPDDAEEPWWSRLWAEEPRQGEIRKQRKSGERITVDQTVAPIMDNHRNVIKQFVVVQRDITQRRNRERHLKVLNRVFRHNVRNTLTTVLSATETSVFDPNPELEAQLTRVENATEQLLSLSETAYDINKLLLQHKPTQYSFEFDTVLKQVVIDHRKRFPNAIITLSTDDGLEVTGTALLDQAVEELVENAVLHNDSDRPQVGVEAVQRGDSVVVRITDDGDGLPNSDARVLNDDLEITPLNHGTGLGLWLAYWAVRKSGGTISVPAASENGTTIELTLQRADTSSPEQERQIFESEPVD